MVVSCVTIFVKPEFVDQFIEATIENHKNSILEKGNLRFDFLRSTQDPTRFFLYEAYIDENSMLEHKKTPHYLKWKETVDPMMAKPREGVVHNILYPKEISQWKTIK